MIVAVVPLLGDDLRQLFRRKAPAAELRVVPSLTGLFQDSVISSREAVDFAVRAISAVAGVISASRGTPRERTMRVVQLSEQAAKALSLSGSDVAAIRIAASLYEVPKFLASENRIVTEVVTPSRKQESGREAHWRLLTEFLDGIGSPFRYSAGRAADEGQLPSSQQIVTAAAEFVLISEEMPQDAILLFRQRAAELELHAAAVEAVIAAASWGQGARRPGRILVVDGDAGARNILALRLTNEGYQATGMADGRAALEAIRKEAPALVISETVLAGVDGYTLLDMLKREGLNIPFIFLSSRNDPVSVNKGLLLGAADFLLKPVNVEILLTKLQKVLGEQVGASDASARLSLSDLTRGRTEAYPTVSYDQLVAGVSILNRFKILAELGEGGMGKVFKAQDERLEETVVLKVMKPAISGDPKVLEHFKREIRLARKISHPSVVRIFDFWEAASLNFVTMEFLEGTDLSVEIMRRGEFPVPVSIRLARELFEGLAVAHALGVVHRDIKPHNILLLKDGHLKILDFGIAQGLDAQGQATGTMTPSVLGTPQYMSPEQILGEKVDARTDLYSGGILLYELLTGVLPFIADNMMETVQMHLNKPAANPSDIAPLIPKELDAIVLRLLAKSRNHRYQTAREVADDLWALTLG